MCNIGGGANRCDEKWDHVKRETVRASRREAYAARKGGKVRVYERKQLATAMPLLSPLGLASSDFADHQAGQTHFDRIQIVGPVNWQKLDEESYKEFGFKGDGELREHPYTDSQKVTDSSLNELSSLSEEEKLGINFYSSDNYKWVNQAMHLNLLEYSETPSEEEIVQAETTLDAVKNSKTKFLSSVDPELRSDALLSQVTGYIDSALLKSPTHQRTVYRGMKLKSFFRGGDEDSQLAALQLGQEIVFDGYQSTSIDPDTAVAYGAGLSNRDGTPSSSLILEIKTRSGLNITSSSQYRGEQEVLLPRNSRYMVVGIQRDTKYETPLSQNNEEMETYTDVLQLVEIDEDGSIA